MSKGLKTLVCVTVQKNCQRLIRAGSEIAAGRKDGLSVVHVASGQDQPQGGIVDGEGLDHLFRISKEYGADMLVFRQDQPLEVLAEYARKIGAECVVLGAPGGGKVNFALELGKRLPDILIETVE